MGLSASAGHVQASRRRAKGGQTLPGAISDIHARSPRGRQRPTDDISAAESEEVLIIAR